MKEKSLNESIIEIRVELQNAKLKKSGKNSFAGFDYFELGDFLPKLNELMLKEGINDNYTIENNEAKLILIKGEEKQEYKMPFIIFDTPLSKNGKPSMQDIQYLGALNTYYKRYLYINAFGITDGEIINSMNNNELTEKKATPKQIEILKKCYQGEKLEKLLQINKINKIEDISLTKASEIIEIIKIIMEKRNSNEWDNKY